MSESEDKPELEATATGHCPPGSIGLAVIPEKNSEEENGAKTVDEAPIGKGEKQAEGEKAADAERVKIPEAVDTMATKTVEAQDLITEECMGTEMVEPENLKMLEEKATKTAEGENIKMAEPEDIKTSEAENVKMLETKGMKLSKDEDVKMPETKGVKTLEAEDVKLRETEGVKISESQDVKMPETEGVKTLEAEDVKMLETEGVKISESEDAKMLEIEGVETSEAEDVKMPETKAVKMSEAEDIEVPKTKGVKMSEAEDIKMSEVEDVKVPEGEDVKVPEVEDSKIPALEDAKNPEAKDVKLQEAEDPKLLENMDVKMTQAEDVKVMENEDTEMPEAENLRKPEVENARMLGVADAKDKEIMEGGETEDGMKETIEKDDNSAEKEEEESKGAKGLKKKRLRGQGVEDKGEGKEKKENDTKEKELLSNPMAFSAERPVRERKTVERLVEVLEKEQVKKFVIEKGCGTPLKDIPNVARKLARKKPADLKLLHQALFGRIGKAVDFKNHILQFSGFAWHESEEKQKTKLKEKLDKYVKETLLDLCDLFNIPVSKATMKKEELVAMLLDFMAAPHAMANAVLTGKEQQSMKSRKRKRVGEESPLMSLGFVPAKWFKKKRTKNLGAPKTILKSGDELEEDAEVDEKEIGVPEEDEAPQQSDRDKKKSKPTEGAEEDKNTIEDSLKGKPNLKRSFKRGGSASAEKLKVVFSTKKAVHPSMTNSLFKRSGMKESKSDESKDLVAKVFSRKKRNADPQKNSVSKLDHKTNTTDKMAGKGKAKSKEIKESGPSKEELRKTVCEILKDVDFNTATFTDIFKQLASHYNMDLTRRKPSIKLIVEEELTKLADEPEENEDDDVGGGTDETEYPELTGKEIKA